MLKNLFILSVIAIAFDDFYPLLPLGEAEHELASYLLIPAMIMALLHRQTQQHFRYHGHQKQEGIYALNQIMILFLSVIAISFAANWQSIISNSYRGRSADAKFITTTAIVIYSFCISYLAYYFVNRYNMYDLVVPPTAISVLICFVVACMEIASWYSAPILAVYKGLSQIIHMGSMISSQSAPNGTGWSWPDVQGRARGTCFEPPALGNFAGFAWPWIYAGYSMTKGKKKAGYLLLLIMDTSLHFMAVSRTAFLLLASNIITLASLNLVYLPSKPLKHPIIARILTLIYIMGGIIAPVMIYRNQDNVIQSVLTSDNVSNISRYASNTAAYRIFADNPFLGVGFGQYGFYAAKYMPQWGYEFSFEIREWLGNPRAVWPPVYSMYARLSAELGMAGLGFWIGLWIWLAYKIVTTTIAYRRMGGVAQPMAFPLVMGCFCVLIGGIPLESFRNPLMWINLGFSCWYIAHTQRQLHSMTGTLKKPERL